MTNKIRCSFLEPKERNITVFPPCTPLVPFFQLPINIQELLNGVWLEEFMIGKPSLIQLDVTSVDILQPGYSSSLRKKVGLWCGTKPISLKLNREDINMKKMELLTLLEYLYVIHTYHLPHLPFHQDNLILQLLMSWQLIKASQTTMISLQKIFGMIFWKIVQTI